MVFSVIYAGDDKSFYRDLNKLSRKMGFNLQNYTHKNLKNLGCTIKSIIQDNINLLIIDAVSDYTHDYRQLLALKSNSHQPPWLILAVSPSLWRESSVNIDEICNSPYDIFDEIIYKPHSSAELLLEKRLNISLAAYQKKYLCMGCSSPSAPEHSLLKKNISLTKRVSQLQSQLTQTSVALKLHEDALAKIKRISQLSRLINCLDLSTIASVCVENIPQLISARYASLFSFDAEKNTLHLIDHNHPYKISSNVSVADNPNSPMGHVINQKKLMVIDDFSQWQKEQQEQIKCIFCSNYQTNSCIIAPLLSADRILGILNLSDKINGHSFDKQSDLPAIVLLCEIIGSAMSNIELYREMQIQARTDSMTKLLNHLTFYEELYKETNRAVRYGNSLSLIMVDMDNLKQINDQLGHQAGDAVLVHIAEKISECIRDIDIAARYGGDEFAVILPNTSLADAMIVAQRLTEDVSTSPVRLNGTSIQASVSIGVAQYDPSISADEFMNQADKALIDAKNAGKNRVQICQTTL